MEEQVKRKRGRPKKIKLPEPIQQLVEETQQKSEIVKQPIISEGQLSTWDIPIDQPIEFFDINLSYELTGYRPITKDKGLDFNPDWFTEVRETFLRTGHYCEFRPNTRAYAEFWDEQYRRCRNGMTSHGYTITGDNYFFLNFFQLMDLDNTSKAGGGRLYIFPAFYAGQYEWFHYVELCRKLRLNACIMKSREVGYSESIAAILANSYNSIRNTVNLVTAFNSDHLNNTLSKVWNCLSFLNDNTDGGFFKLRQVIDKQDHKRASVYKMIDGQKVETGWMSQIIGITADKPSKIRGYRSDLLVMEECFGKGTKVRMSDYSIKNIEDIKVGDFVLGLDGTPQEVMNTTHGIDSLYEVQQKRGNNYIVNSKHKLYLERRPRMSNIPDHIELMTVGEYNQLSSYNKRTTYGKTNNPIDNLKNVCDIDPYYLGLWIGDGYTALPQKIIINRDKDPEIYQYVQDYFKQYDGIHITEYECENCSQCVKLIASINQRKTNPIKYQFQSYNLVGNKHIPKEVFYSTLDYKLKVLAGIIDTDGNIVKNRSYEVAMSNETLIKEIGVLAQTCGFDVHYNSRIMRKGFKDGSVSYRVSIKGQINKIPVKVWRKICSNDRFNTTNSTPINIIEAGVGEYYGITLKSYNKQTDNLFLLEDFTIVHNCGSWPGSTKAYIQSTALVGPKGAQWGIRIVGGTSGDTGAALEGLRDMYYNPQTYAILPFKHTYTMTKEECLTAFFMPCTKIMKDRKTFLSHRGYVDEEKAIAFHNNVRESMLASPKALIQHQAEFPFNDSEAFNLEGDNKFNKVNIAEQLTNIRALKKCPTIETGFLEYKYKEGAHIEQNLDGFKWIPNQNGKIKILEHPLWNLPEKRDEDGNVIWRPPEKIRDLYVIGIDGIDIGKSQTSEYTKDPSDFCLVVYKRTYGISEPQFVAIYKDRPDDIREAYKIAIKLAQYYNAIINIEATRQSIIPYARERKLLKLFMKRPRATLGDSARNTNKQYGTPATPAIINHQTDLIADYVNDYCHLIWFEEMLDELNRYNDENKRKFDIIASMAMALLADEELQGIVPRNVEEVKQSWQDIGFYIDAQGRKRYGVIPKQNSQILISNEFGQLYDDTRIRTSNTRLSSGYL